MNFYIRRSRETHNSTFFQVTIGKQHWTVEFTPDTHIGKFVSEENANANFESKYDPEQPPTFFQWIEDQLKEQND